MKREEIIEHIVGISGDNPIISTTGKASRELFEIREKNKQSHKYDFLTGNDELKVVIDYVVHKGVEYSIVKYLRVSGAYRSFFHVLFV